MENQQYDHIHTEKKWRKNWEDRDAFKAYDSNNGGENDTRPKHYILDMFPYPSGAGLHVGHPEGYTATDIISRFKRMHGFNVLHPMGWDAFGLPAENYAIKTNVAPEKSTRGNIENFTEQIKSLGFSYDWEREITTCDPSYYKWTQWFFLLLYNNGLAYKKEAAVNWCNDCMTVLANEQVIDGKCDRCHNEVIQKNLAQWFFRITDFIEDYTNPTTGRVTRGLISGLDTIDWPDSTRTSQLNWIGESKGAEVEFKIENSNEILTIFTTRPDTLFGATFMVIAPEHQLAEEITTPENKSAVEKYLKASSMRTQLERQSDTTKTGVFTGAYGINPVNGANIPIYIADYVFMGYGTGAIMAVPAHDERDWHFSEKFKIPRICVIDPGEINSDEEIEKFKVAITSIAGSIPHYKEALMKKRQGILQGETLWTSQQGTMVNSEFLNGLNVEDAKAKMIEWLESERIGKGKTTYKLRDWLISRQRYWGAPIPIVYDAEGKAQAMKEADLPLVLPTDVDYKPKGTSPLGSSKEFKQRAEKMYGEGAKFEIDTMDTFVCSSWYFWRFMDPKNEKLFAGSEAIKKWGQVDLYVGGAEHTVLHLLYSRFFCKVLHKLGYIDYDEPFYKLRHQGMILGEDGEKMSKSRGNVINPNEIVEKFGADTLRMYEMFMGPFKDMKPWNTNGVTGIYRFLQKVWKLSMEVHQNGFAKDDSCERLRHKTIKKVTEDTEEFKFNTAVSQMMVFVNDLTANGATRDDMKSLLLILGIYAPHMCAELWERLGFEKELGYLDQQDWPDFDKKLCVDSEIEFAVQVNGKLRGTFIGAKDISKEDALSSARALDNVAKYLAEGEVVKEIYVPGKLVSFVMK